MKIDIVDNKHNTLVRDSDNRAILESDKSKITEYESKRQLYLQTEANKSEIEFIKNEMTDIKNLLLKLIEK